MPSTLLCGVLASFHALRHRGKTDRLGCLRYRPVAAGASWAFYQEAPSCPSQRIGISAAAAGRPDGAQATGCSQRALSSQEEARARAAPMASRRLAWSSMIGAILACLALATQPQAEAAQAGGGGGAATEPPQQLWGPLSPGQASVSTAAEFLQALEQNVGEIILQGDCGSTCRCRHAPFHECWPGMLALTPGWGGLLHAHLHPARASLSCAGGILAPEQFGALGWQPTSANSPLTPSPPRHCVQRTSS